MGYSKQYQLILDLGPNSISPSLLHLLTSSRTRRVVLSVTGMIQWSLLGCMRQQSSTTKSFWRRWEVTDHKLVFFACIAYALYLPTLLSYELVPVRLLQFAHFRLNSFKKLLFEIKIALGHACPVLGFY